jgi:hypothetical protein
MHLFSQETEQNFVLRVVSLKDIFMEFKLFDLTTKSVFVSRNVIFHYGYFFHMRPCLQIIL